MKKADLGEIKEITVTSGSINGCSEDTGIKKVEGAKWSTRWVTVKVSDFSREREIAAINDRLRGRVPKGVSTAS